MKTKADKGTYRVRRISQQRESRGGTGMRIDIRTDKRTNMRTDRMTDIKPTEGWT